MTFPGKVPVQIRLAAREVLGESGTDAGLRQQIAEQRCISPRQLSTLARQFE